MNDDELLLHTKELGFLGSITASVSHEINNVFATINELSGLLDDYFVAFERGSSPDLEKFRETTDRIAVQVNRGQRYVNHLNGFAHTLDEETSTFEFNETVEAITTLCRRFGMLLRVEIKSTLSESSPKIQGNPYVLQHVVFRCIDLILKVTNPGDVLAVLAESNNDSTSLTFSNASPVQITTEMSSQLSFISALVPQMQGEFESVMHTGQPARLTVTIPH